MGKPKRAVKYEVINLNKLFFEKILYQLKTNSLEYKLYPDRLPLRDSAAVATLTLTGLRASELVLLKKKQIVNHGDLIRIHKVKTLKGGLMRDQIPLPTRGILSKFTKIITTWISFVPNDEYYIFPRAHSFGINFRTHLKRYRIYQIVYALTGKYPHYFRSVCATLYGKYILKDAWMLKQFMGWSNLNSSSPYVKSAWERKEKLINEIF
jgi:integrase